MGGRHQRCLRRASLTHNFTRAEENWVHAKKKTYGYLERDESKRQIFIEQLAQWADETIVYVDEAGMDNREDYGYGWNSLLTTVSCIEVGTTARASEYEKQPFVRSN